MLLIPTKNPGDQYFSNEFNSFYGDVKSLIETTGQTLSGLDQVQTSKGAATYAAASSFYTDSGAANAYILSPQGSLETPVAYSNGMEIRFASANENTGASTVNVNGLGDKPILTQNGNALPPRQLRANIIHIASFDTAADGFILNARYAPFGSQMGQMRISATLIDITIAERMAARDNTDTLDILLESTFTKQLTNVFAPGTGNGGRAAGVPLAINTTYNVFLIYNANTGLVDVGFDTDFLAVNLLLTAPTFTHFRRLWTIHTGPASTDIIPFKQYGMTCFFIERIILATGTSSLPPFEINITPLGIPRSPDLIGIFNGRFSFTGAGGGTRTGFVNGFGFDNNTSLVANLAVDARRTAPGPFELPIGLLANVPTIKFNTSADAFSFEVEQLGWRDNRDIF
jgi:hypothetical protein